MIYKIFNIDGVHMNQHRLDKLYELFHENTKLSLTTESMFAKRIETVLRNPVMVEMLCKGYNQFPHLPRIELSRNVPSMECRLDEAILRRRSVRDFTGKPLTLTELNQLLFLSYGITKPQCEDNIQEFRAAPSAGGLYPIELYIVVRQVTGLEQGIYHYNVPDHALEKMPKSLNFDKSLKAVSSYESILSNASVLFVLTAVFERSTVKYGDRGYRFIHLDAGHIAQNILLITAAINLGAVPLGGFRDDQLSMMVGGDGINEAPVYLIAVGQPKHRDN